MLSLKCVDSGMQSGINNSTRYFWKLTDISSNQIIPLIPNLSIKYQKCCLLALSRLWESLWAVSMAEGLARAPGLPGFILLGSFTCGFDFGRILW